MTLELPFRADKWRAWRQRNRFGLRTHPEVVHPLWITRIADDTNEILLTVDIDLVAEHRHNRNPFPRPDRMLQNLRRIHLHPVNFPILKLATVDNVGF